MFKILIKRRLVSLLVATVVISQLIIPVTISASPNLTVEIYVYPASGPAPLENVDITVTVTGTATGDITYKFDCTNDGSWEKTVTTGNTSYTAENICDYSSPGNYAAKVSVEREGLVFQGTTAIMVDSGDQLSVDLSANPSTGDAPLYNVDLTATVSGSATGDITYRFDCTSNGSWEKTITTGSTSYTASDLCDYYTSGNYITKVKVERSGLSFQGTAAIVVNHDEEEAFLSIDKRGRNISQDKTSWVNTVNAEPEEIVEFQIKVTSNGDETAEDVMVSDVLPNKMSYHGDLRIDGSRVYGKDIEDGLDIGDLQSDESKTITFEAKVDSKNNFGSSTTSLINKAKALADNVSLVTDTAVVRVSKDDEGDSSLSVSKLGRNLSQNKTSWINTISAKPGENIEFRIKVTSNGDETAEDVVVTDALPNKMTYLGNLKVSGTLRDEENINYGVNVGNISPGKTKTITFEAKIDPKENFGYGTTILINTGVAYADNISSVNDTAKVEVKKTKVAGATTVGTGVMDYLYISLMIVFAMSLGIYLLFWSAEHAQNRTIKRMLRKFYLFKLYIMPKQR